MPSPRHPNIRLRLRGTRMTFGPEWIDAESSNAQWALVRLTIEASENPNISMDALQDCARQIAQMFSFQRARVMRVHPISASRKLAKTLGIPHREAYVEDQILTHLRNAHPDYLRKIYNAQAN